MKNHRWNLVTIALIVGALALSACGGKIISQQDLAADTSGGGGGGGEIPTLTPQEILDNFIKEQKKKGGAQNVVANRPGYASNPGVDSNTDNDTKLNPEDNCPYVDNEGQEDQDRDGVGDACDNCPNIANSNQENVCNPDAPEFKGSESVRQKWKAQHTDSDNDGLPDYWDKCPYKANPLKAGKTAGSKDFNDYEGLDSDKDNDGIVDGCDNCPDIPNPEQVDLDSNGRGDVCQSGPLGSGGCTPGPEGDKFCKDNKLGDTCSNDHKCVCGESTVKGQREKLNLIFILDTSGSMAGDGMDQMKTALDTFANISYDKFDYGFYAYPGVGWLGGTKLAAYTTSASMQNVYSSLSAGGGTPTASALNEVERAYESGDIRLLRETKTKKTIALLLTDGDPNNASATAQAATDLYNAGVELYVVGMGGLKADSLIACAKNGSGNKRSTYFVTSDSASLSKTLRSIAKESASCDIKVPATQNSSKRVFVSANGNQLIQDVDFKYNTQEKRVTLNDAVCSRVNSVDNPTINITLGCGFCVPDRDADGNILYNPATDEGAQGLCDGRDNDCDGDTDEGCNCGSGEICGDHLDNDCDGVIDNGCVGTKQKGDECKDSSDCIVGLFCEFDDALQKKVCKAPCKGLGASCADGGDCCSGNCNSGICSAG